MTHAVPPRRLSYRSRSQDCSRTLRLYCLQPSLTVGRLAAPWRRGSCLLPLVSLQQQAWQQITFQRKLRFLLACLVCRQLRLEERRLRNCYLAGRKPPDPSGTRSMITELSEGIFSPRCCWGLARNSRASFRFLPQARMNRSEEHTSELQSLMRI